MPRNQQAAGGERPGRALKTSASDAGRNRWAIQAMEVPPAWETKGMRRVPDGSPVPEAREAGRDNALAEHRLWHWAIELECLSIVIATHPFVARFADLGKSFQRSTTSGVMQPIWH